MSKPAVIALHIVISLLLTGMWLFGAKVMRTMFISTEHGFKDYVAMSRLDVQRKLEDKSFHQVYVREASITNQHGMVISGFQYFVPPDGPQSQTFVFAWSRPGWGEFYATQNSPANPAK